MAPAPSVSDLADRLSSQSLVRRREPLAPRTTLRVGGPADWYVEPASEAELSAVLEFCAERGLPFFILGRGSNLLVRDAGFRGVVLSLIRPAFSRLEIDGLRIQCGAGARLKALAVEARRHGIAGLEFFEGIPGTLGGALRMNAGAMGAATFDRVESLRLMDYHGNITELPRREIQVQYRRCPSLQEHIALSAVLCGEQDVPERIEARMNEYSRKRWDSQPAAPSAGCMFKNPSAIPAGKLIDELGLKGLRIGGAHVSEKHGNFLVNDGTATAADVLELLRLVQQRVCDARGIQLETEVVILGDAAPTAADPTSDS